MEQTRYWTWTRRKLSGLPRIQPFSPASVALASYDSWEEQAFAEDAAGGLGGCVWPPRSYSCSFCRREFRSAQALGGHMNVHRRDRARLKQSPPVENNMHILHPNHQHQQLLQCHPCPTQIDHPVVCNPNPNQGVDIATTSLSLSSFNLPSNQANCRNLVSPLAQGSSKHLFFSAPNLATQPIPELKLGGQDLVTSGKRGRDSCYEEEKRSTGGDNKRQRIDDHEGLPSSLNLKSSDDHCLRLRIETAQHDHTSPEELDLELRLGDRPKFKENCSGSSA